MINSSMSPRTYRNRIKARNAMAMLLSHRSRSAHRRDRRNRHGARARRSGLRRPFATPSMDTAGAARARPCPVGTFGAGTIIGVRGLSSRQLCGSSSESSDPGGTRSRRISPARETHRVSQVTATLGCPNHRPPCISIPPGCACVRSSIISGAFSALSARLRRPPLPRRTHRRNLRQAVAVAYLRPLRSTPHCASGSRPSRVHEHVRQSAYC